MRKNNHSKRLNRISEKRGNSSIVRLKRFQERLREWISAPWFNVVILVVLMISVFGILRLAAGNRQSAQIRFREPSRPESVQKNDSAVSHFARTTEIFEGEVYETSVRLRETGALGLAITLVLFNERAQEARAVSTKFSTLAAALVEQKLLPPDLRLAPDGQFESTMNKFEIRYDAQNARFEILAFGKDDPRKPAILLRFPYISLDGRNITYFQTVNSEAKPRPAPFVSIDKLVAGGWLPEQWRGEFTNINREDARRLAEEEKRILDQIVLKRQ